MYRKIFSLFAFVFVVACDGGPTNPAPDEQVTPRGFETAKPWGACKGGPFGVCEPDAFCLSDSTDKSSICAPACKVGGCPPIPQDLCGAEPGCDDAGACLMFCAVDADCIFAGMKCSDGGWCAHPKL